MKYERFEDLPVWQLAADLAATMFDWTQHPSFRAKGDLANQIQRATLSISNNIAEGFERGSTKDLLNFLYIARGSAGEVRSMLCVLERMNGNSELKTEITNLKSTCESISRQIRGWTHSLQNSEIEGQRHLNDQSRARYESRKRSEEANSRRREWQANFEAQLNSRVAERRDLEKVKQVPSTKATTSETKADET